MIHYSTFSEAIREGIKIVPNQTFGILFTENSACALGTGLAGIYESLSEVSNRNDYSSLLSNFHPYLDITSYCPSCFGEESIDRFARLPHRIKDLIWHLNDKHEWTRESIIDWLEAKEEQLGFVLLSEPEIQSKELVFA